MQAFQRGVAEYLPVPTKLPELGRNWAIKEFLTNPEHAKKTHIFFIDADTVPIELMAIEMLLKHNKPVVAGVTPIVRKAEEIRCMWSVIVDDPDQADNMSCLGIDELPKKLFKAKRVGGTTILIRRDVLERLEPPYQKSTFNEDMTGQTDSEDYYFSDKIREAGYVIWVDPDVRCHHYHKFDLLDVFSVYLESRDK
jgi:GT2 family glycosyltransferase